MDCMCCADGGVGPSSDKEFLSSVCNLTTADGQPAKFPVEKDRYILYVAAGCPFAARPWVLQALYGLPIQVVKVFPATYEDGWFFEAQSEGEKDLVNKITSPTVDPDPYGNHHLAQLYKVANPKFEGVVSVPLLWDKVNNTAVSNSSLGLAEMLEKQLKPTLATRNQDLELYPTDEPLAQEHTDLIQMIHSKVSTAVYRIAASNDSKTHDDMVHDYYQTLFELQDRLTNNGPKAFLMGDKLRFADIVLWISLIRLDLCYRFRFGLGKYSIREGEPVMVVI
jgi:glutathionyl-hydroquinone reductase